MHARSALLDVALCVWSGRLAQSRGGIMPRGKQKPRLVFGLPEMTKALAATVSAKGPPSWQRIALVEIEPTVIVINLAVDLKSDAREV